MAFVAATPEAKASPTRKVTKPAIEFAPKEAKPAKAKRAKLVHDSFTMPASEYAAVTTLKIRCLNLSVAAKKREILRAAIATPA